TPLHLACQKNNENIVKYLVEQPSANVNTQNKNGNTALHLACQNKNENIVKCLIEKGANVNTQNKDENTPLHLACQKIMKTL
ncbi:hypothetical protein PIROE2DRAFT_46137, partial [Piromyces sp. E2]